MRRGMPSRVLSFFAMAVLAVLAGPRHSLAAPPANDNFVDAIQVTTLPFTDSVDLVDATTEPGEFLFTNCSGFPLQRTVWYRISFPTTKVLTLDLNGSDPSAVLFVWQQFGTDLFFTGCASAGGSFQLNPQPGGTYYVQAGTPFLGPGLLQLNVQEVPPPVNDAFANAKEIDQLAYVDPVDLTAATTEPGEPTTPSQAFTPIAGSAWYKFTPDVTQTVMARVSSCCVIPILAVYTGGAVNTLVEVGSRSFGQPLPFEAVAGTTYYLQVGRGAVSGAIAPMTFTLEPAPPPVASFFTFISDPSIYDTVQFQDTSFDPAQIGIASQAWDFGDGTTGSGAFPTHRYAADGEYTVGLTVTTHDGRTGSTSQLLRVKTHDVAIVKFTVPNSARAGQTREITAGVRNRFSPENVQFQLFKSVPGFGGFQLVGTLTQLVPVVQGNKTVPVTMSYTFSQDDAAVGKVTFQIVAQILGGRDAISADNTAIAAPTRVNP